MLRRFIPAKSASSWPRAAGRKCSRKSLPRSKPTPRKRKKFRSGFTWTRTMPSRARPLTTARLSDAGVQLHWHIGAQTSGLCEMQSHFLAGLPGARRKFTWSSADDVRFDTPGWDNVLPRSRGEISRRHFSRQPARPDDGGHLHLSDFRLALAGNAPAAFLRPFSVLV